MNLIPATLCALVVGAVFGYLLDKRAVGAAAPTGHRPDRRARRQHRPVADHALPVYLYFFGGSSRSYGQYATSSRSPRAHLDPAARPGDHGAVGAGPDAVGLALQRTRIGKATRAGRDNPSLAASSGIDVERVINVVWIIGTALAALGGVFLALSQQVSYLLGFQILLLLFAGVTLGGLGTAFGALVGSLVIGIFTQLSTLVIPAELQNVGALVVLILILVVRPQGILGRAERVG
jgi:branched-chain amino acid transport system permease protein